MRGQRRDGLREPCIVAVPAACCWSVELGGNHRLRNTALSKRPVQSEQGLKKLKDRMGAKCVM